VPVHNADPGADEGQSCNMTTGLQCHNTLLFDFSIDQSTSPVPEPGLLNILCIHQVFDMGPESEVEEMENSEGNNEPDEYSPAMGAAEGCTDVVPRFEQGA
jgi:hypothetical protein